MIPFVIFVAVIVKLCTLFSVNILSCHIWRLQPHHWTNYLNLWGFFVPLFYSINRDGDIVDFEMIVIVEIIIW